MKAPHIIASSLTHFNIAIACIVGAILALIALGLLFGWL